jgi:AraC-like DNA-binding protein
MISPREVSEYAERPVSDARGQQQAAVLERVVEFIDRNYMEALSLRDVARAFNYSACHLTNVFSQAMGMPITAWIIKRRILAAQVLLAEQNVDVATACEATGFNDPGYFTRQFVRHVGITPGRFRAAMNGPRPAPIEGEPTCATPRYEGSSQARVGA